MKNKARGPWVLVAGAVVELFAGIPAAWGVFQKPVMEEFGFARSQASLCFALLVAAYGIGCVIGGYLQDAYGPRVAGLAGAALQGGGFIAAAFVPKGSAGLFYLAFSLPAGLGSAFLAPAVLACAQKWYAGRKGLATGITGVSMGLSGAFLTLFVRGVGGALGMRACLGALGGLMLAACGSAAAVLQNPPAAPLSTKKSSPDKDYPPKKMLKTTQYKLCLVGVALASPPVLLFSPDILQIATDRGMTQQAAAWCVVLGSAASAAGRLACPAASDKWGRKTILCLTYGGLGIGSALFAWAGSWWVAAAYAALTFFYSGGASVQPALNTDLFGLPHAGVNYGFMALGMSAGSLASFVGAQLLPLPGRHLAAVASAALGLWCFAAVKETPAPGKAGAGGK